jgi:hypothetical protein
MTYYFVPVAFLSSMMFTAVCGRFARLIDQSKTGMQTNLLSHSKNIIKERLRLNIYTRIPRRTKLRTVLRTRFVIMDSLPRKNTRQRASVFKS